MNHEPKNIHDALRRLNLMVSSVAADIERYLEDPTVYVAPDYFPDVLEAANDAQHLVVWIRHNLKGESSA